MMPVRDRYGEPINEPDDQELDALEVEIRRLMRRGHSRSAATEIAAKTTTSPTTLRRKTDA